MSNYQKQIKDVFLKHGSGSTDLASEIIHLEEENNELIRDVANRKISILALGNRIKELDDENNELRELVNLITKQEMSDSGRIFYPTSVDSCRCMDLEKIGQITEKYRSTPHISE